MRIYPAIDLKNGQCVRLSKGDFATAKIYSDNPLLMLNQFAQCGATWVHMVDLDGAQQGKFAQGELIKHLVKSSTINIQVGGGIRTTDDIEQLLDLGVKRVVVGSICVSNTLLVQEWLNKFGKEKLVLALDCSINEQGIPMVKTHGWQSDSSSTLWGLLQEYAAAKYVLCTDISVDGMLSGPNLALYQEFSQRFPEISLLASGGVGGIEDLQKLKHLNLHGVVVGKAIYEGKIPLDKIEFE